jgi:hypothetical protein
MGDRRSFILLKGVHDMKQNLTFESIKNLFHKYYVPAIVSAVFWIGNGTANLINTYHRQAVSQRIEQLQSQQRNETANKLQDAQLARIEESLRNIRDRLDRQPKNKE